MLTFEIGENHQDGTRSDSRDYEKGVNRGNVAERAIAHHGLSRELACKFTADPDQRAGANSDGCATPCRSVCCNDGSVAMDGASIDEFHVTYVDRFA